MGFDVEEPVGRRGRLRALFRLDELGLLVNAPSRGGSRMTQACVLTGPITTLAPTCLASKAGKIIYFSLSHKSNRRSLCDFGYSTWELTWPVIVEMMTADAAQRVLSHPHPDARRWEEGTFPLGSDPTYTCTCRCSGRR